MKVLILIFLFIKFLWEYLSAFVRFTKDDALVNDERTVYLEYCSHFLFLVDEHVVMSEADQHQFVHQVNHFCSWHEFLLKWSDSNGEGGWVHQKSAFRTEVIHYFLNIFLEIAFQETICFIEHKELALSQQIIILFDDVLQPSRCAYNHMNDLILNFGVVFLDHGSSNEELDINLLKLGYFLSQSLYL